MVSYKVRRKCSIKQRVTAVKTAVTRSGRYEPGVTTEFGNMKVKGVFLLLLFFLKEKGCYISAGINRISPITKEEVIWKDDNCSSKVIERLEG